MHMLFVFVKNKYKSSKHISKDFFSTLCWSTFPEKQEEKLNDFKKYIINPYRKVNIIVLCCL